MVEPIGEQWSQTAQLSTLFHQLINVNLASAGVKVQPPEFESYMPGRYMPVEKPKPQQDTASMFSTFATMFNMSGVVDGRND
jgi:hypothetical protein